MLTNSRWIVLLLSVAIALMPTRISIGETAPHNGTFTAYFFKDRWGQGVFDYFFVKPKLEYLPQLGDPAWRPIVLTSNDIYQPMNPGAAMILQIDRIEQLPEPSLQIRLAVDNHSIVFGEQTKLRIRLTNTSNQPIELHTSSISLYTTVHLRGLHPDRKVEMDELFDCFNSEYDDFGLVDSEGKDTFYYLALLHQRYDLGTRTRVRATLSDPLFTNLGYVRTHGELGIAVGRNGGRIESQPVLDGNTSREFTCSLGRGWLVNQYELQVRCSMGGKAQVPYILSPPLSFDVVARR